MEFGILVLTHEMDIVQAIILGVVEGITEFLPISSTGHLVLTAELLHIPQSEFVKSFEVIIQLGAILAVISIYGKKLWQNKKLWPILLIAFLPTAVVGFTLYKVIKHLLIGNTMLTLWALFIGGIILIIWDYFYKEKEHHESNIEKLSYKKAFLVGVFQSFSIVPGVSRAAATIIGGLTVGLTRKAAVEMSFLLAVPTLAAASGLDLIESKFAFTSFEWVLLAIGFVVSFFTALAAVKFFIKYIADHTFMAFGVYRIILAIVFWIFVM